MWIMAWQNFDAMTTVNMGCIVIVVHDTWTDTLFCRFISYIEL
jgi:hypothetical protein